MDTGAEKTLVQPYLLDAKQLPDAPQRLCGVTMHCMSLKGPVKHVLALAAWRCGCQCTLPAWMKSAC